MKKALIDPRENRVCQIEESEGIFPVAEPLFWIDVPEELQDEINTSEYEYYDEGFHLIIEE